MSEEPPSDTGTTEGQDEHLFNPAEFGSEVADDAAREVFEAISRSASYDTSAPLRLKRIRLRRILGFEDSTVELDNFKVLVGANNSGKSSMMRAVAFAQTLIKAHVERVDDERVVLARGRNLADSLLPVPEVGTSGSRGRVGSATNGSWPRSSSRAAASTLSSTASISGGPAPPRRVIAYGGYGLAGIIYLPRR